MSITFKKGNVVDAVLNGEAHFMLHVANCQGVMGSGVAKEVKAKFPSAFEHYKEALEVGNGLGWFSCSKDYKVYNLHAQEYYGSDRNKHYLSYKALVESLAALAELEEDFQGVFGEHLKIAIPYKMGSDRAGGDWNTVLEIVDGFLGHHEIIVYEL